MAKNNEQAAKSIIAPWLNADGTKKTDREISKIGEKWSSQTWNLYLESEVGTLKDENLVFYEDFDNQESLERSDVLKFLQNCKSHEALEQALIIALKRLSKTERVIIKEAFWNSGTDKEISRKLHKTQENVRVLKARAIKKLGQILVSNELKNRVLYFKNQKNDLLGIPEQKQRVS